MKAFKIVFLAALFAGFASQAMAFSFSVSGPACCVPSPYSGGSGCDNLPICPEKIMNQVMASFPHRSVSCCVPSPYGDGGCGSTPVCPELR